ncbi:hypothetical protein ACSYAD_33225 [Acaryochloris marina NIES-2412]|uniref:hypothetical protein n=1 Tax=Acaryochloris marina TaxID=155978 RepID=UPI004059873D
MQTLALAILLGLGVPSGVIAQSDNLTVEQCSQTIPFDQYKRAVRVEKIEELTVVTSIKNYHLIGVTEAGHNWWVIIKTNPCEVVLMDPQSHGETFKGVVPDDVAKHLDAAATAYGKEFYKDWYRRKSEVNTNGR